MQQACIQSMISSSSLSTVATEGRRTVGSQEGVRPQLLDRAAREQLLGEIFETIDCDKCGVIRSYDIWLSDLRPQLKHLVHELISVCDGEGYFVFNRDLFQQVLVKSDQLFAVACGSGRFKHN